MHADRSNAIDFWPGYVDALINVVLNLLFVVSIFCGGLLATGLQVTTATLPNEHRPGSTAALSTSTSTPTPTPASIASVSDGQVRPAASRTPPDLKPVPPPTSESTARAAQSLTPTDTAATVPENSLSALDTLTLRVRSTSSLPTEMAPVRIAEVAGPGASRRLDISYPTGMLVLDDAAVATLARWVTPERPGPAIRIAASTDLEQAAARQATYRRLIAVRDALVAAGLPRSAMDIRLQPGGQWPERRGGTVWVQEMSATSEVPDTPAP